jgi:mono/diheme cytochrome c family protein
MSGKYLAPLPPIVALVALVASAGCKKSQAAEASPQGKELFASACARCHGPDGTGGFPVSPGGPSPRNFRDRAFQTSHTDDQIKTTIVNGKGTAMPPFGATFDEGQLRALVGTVRSFDPER